MKYTYTKELYKMAREATAIGGSCAMSTSTLSALLDEIDRLHEAERWIPVEEKLPDVVEKDGEVNTVFVKYKKEYQPDCGSIYSTSNTVYLAAHPEHYECWKYPELPTPPEGE